MEEKRDFQGCPEKRKSKQYQKPTLTKYAKPKKAIEAATTTTSSN